MKCRLRMVTIPMSYSSRLITLHQKKVPPLKEEVSMTIRSIVSVATPPLTSSCHEYRRLIFPQCNRSVGRAMRRPALAHEISETRSQALDGDSVRRQERNLHRCRCVKASMAGRSQISTSCFKRHLRPGELLESGCPRYAQELLA